MPPAPASGGQKIPLKKGGLRGLFLLTHSRLYAAQTDLYLPRICTRFYIKEFFDIVSMRL